MELELEETGVAEETGIAMEVCDSVRFETLPCISSRT